MLAAACAPIAAAQSMSDAVWRSYSAGEIEKAISEAERELHLAEADGTRGAARLWNALMTSAFLHNTTGGHREAIALSARALDLTEKFKPSERPFRKGRALCWLGWAHARLALYDVAQGFFQEAAALGAPQGKVTVVPVWGLATQELGAIQIRRGEIEAGRKLLQQTTSYARQHGIAVGVAEGGAYLAELALFEGQYGEAERLANEAVAAAISCGCSDYNQLRAELVLAEAAVAQTNSQGIEEVRRLAARTVAEAEKRNVRPAVARGKLLLARLLPPDAVAEREKLLTEAESLLELTGGEERGVAKRELGTLYLDKKDLFLAEIYLRNGLQFSNESLRRVDISRLQGEMGRLYIEREMDDAAASELLAAKNSAVKLGELPGIVNNARKLGELYERRRLYALAVEEYQSAVDAVEAMVAREDSAAAIKNIQPALLALRERIIDIRSTAGLVDGAQPAL